jgi:hypothetical protein
MPGRDNRAPRELVSQAINLDVPEPFGAYVFAGDEPGAAASRMLEQSVFLEAFGNTAEQLAEEYGRYESSSIFFCVIDHLRQEIAGVIRMILPTKGGPGLKSCNDLPPTWGASATELFAASGLTLRRKHTWDIATLAVAPEYRSPAALGLVSLGIYQSFIRTACWCGVEAFVTILDRVALRMLRMRLRAPFVAIGEPQPYLGSPLSVPAVLDLAEYEARLLQVDRTLHAVIYEGDGLEPALRPIDKAIAIARGSHGAPRSRVTMSRLS